LFAVCLLRINLKSCFVFFVRKKNKLKKKKKKKEKNFESKMSEEEKNIKIVEKKNELVGLNMTMPVEKAFVLLTRVLRLARQMTQQSEMLLTKMKMADFLAIEATSLKETAEEHVRQVYAEFVNLFIASMKTKQHTSVCAAACAKALQSFGSQFGITQIDEDIQSEIQSFNQDLDKIYSRNVGGKYAMPMSTFLLFQSHVLRLAANMLDEGTALAGKSLLETCNDLD
jgi:hypothetical protein